MTTTDSPPRFMAVTLSSPRLCKATKWRHAPGQGFEHAYPNYCGRVTTVGIVPALTPLAPPAPRCAACMPAELQKDEAA